MDIFETGALSKNIEKSSICPLLFGLSSINLKQPLSQFQATLPNKEDIFKLVETINEQLGKNRLEKDILKESFNMRWPCLESKLDEIIELAKKETTEKGAELTRSTEDILEELLAISRGVASQLSDLKTPPPSSDKLTTINDFLGVQHKFSPDSTLGLFSDDVLRQARRKAIDEAQEAYEKKKSEKNDK